MFRVRSADNLDSSEDSTRRPTVSSKENLTPASSSADHPQHQSAQKASSRIAPEQARSSRHSQSINRQRPATYHMASNLQKSMRENAQRWYQRVVREKGIDGLKTEFATMKRPVDASSLAKVFLEQAAGTKNRYRVNTSFSRFNNNAFLIRMSFA